MGIPLAAKSVVVMISVVVFCGCVLATQPTKRNCEKDALLYFAISDLSSDPTGAHINHVDLKGKDLTEVIPVSGSVRGVALDRKHRKIYWSEVNDARILRCDFDGTNREIVLTGNGLQFPFALAIDTVHNKLYWGDQSANQIGRANLDGSNPEVIISTTFSAGLVLDVCRDRLFWDTSITDHTGEIWQARLDGTQPQLVQTAPAGIDSFKPAWLALDKHGFLYWSDFVVDVIQRAPLSASPGTGIETIYTVGENRNPGPLVVACDKVYFVQDISLTSAHTAIMRMKLDGSALHTVLRNQPNAMTALTADVCPPPSVADDVCDTVQV